MPNLSSEVLRNLVYRYVNSSLTYPLYTRKWRAFEVFKTRRNPQALLHILNTIYYISINYITNINFQVCAQLHHTCRITASYLSSQPHSACHLATACRHPSPSAVLHCLGEPHSACHRAPASYRHRTPLHTCRSCQPKTKPLHPGWPPWYSGCI